MISNTEKKLAWSKNTTDLKRILILRRKVLYNSSMLIDNIQVNLWPSSLEFELDNFKLSLVTCNIQWSLKFFHNNRYHSSQSFGYRGRKFHFEVLNLFLLSNSIKIEPVAQGRKMGLNFLYRLSKVESIVSALWKIMRSLLSGLNFGGVSTHPVKISIWKEERKKDVLWRTNEAESHM